MIPKAGAPHCAQGGPFALVPSVLVPSLACSIPSRGGQKYIHVQPTKILIELITGYQDHDCRVEISGRKGVGCQLEPNFEATQGCFFCETAQPTQSAINPEYRSS